MNIKLFTLLISLFNAAILYAGTMGNAPVQRSWVATLSLGPAWTNPGQTQTLWLQSGVQKTYAALSRTNSLGVAELFGGMQSLMPSCNNMHVQYGLALSSATPVPLSGTIWEDANPNFNNFNEEYSLRHGHIAAKGKFIAHEMIGMQPYLSGSLGVGFNRAYGFMITPKIIEEIPGPNFTNHTTTAFTYTLGLGVQKELTNHWLAGVGYQFADWGKTQLGLAPGQTQGNRILN